MWWTVATCSTPAYKNVTIRYCSRMTRPCQISARCSRPSIYIDTRLTLPWLAHPSSVTSLPTTFVRPSEVSLLNLAHQHWLDKHFLFVITIRWFINITNSFYLFVKSANGLVTKTFMMCSTHVWKFYTTSESKFIYRKTFTNKTFISSHIFY